MKFQHNYNTEDHERIMEEHDSENTLVDRAGYTSMEKRIQALQDAGHRLEAARRDQYHFGQGEQVQHDYIDPSLDANLDISDIDHTINTNMDSLAASGQERNEAAKKKRAESRAKKVAEAKEIAAAAQKELDDEKKIDPQAGNNDRAESP